MSGKIYKYFSEDVFDLVFFKPDFCSIKCSLPMDYNDPYELFLGADLTVDTDMLASYREIIVELPQLPTSCFSRSPVVSPMWAHYGGNHSGFVVEFDVDSLESKFSDILIKDITYRSEPDPAIFSQLQRAVGTKKLRHAYFLQQAVLFSAYFSKDVAWSYERECRLVDQEQYCETISGHQILHIPIECCTAIIAGSKSKDLLVEKTKGVAFEGDVRWFQSVIGKSVAQPFMVDGIGRRAVFDGSAIVSAVNECANCAEPIVEEQINCAWCSITEGHALQAANGNPLRMLERMGRLEGYYKSMEQLSRAGRRS